MRTGAAILAGGRSLRMGGVDKQAIPIGGVPMGERLARRFAARFGEVIVVTGNGGLYQGMGVRTVSDIIPGFGPLSGLHAALSATGSEWLYLAACDMPGFSEAWLERLEAIAAGPGRAPAPHAVVAGFGSHIEPFHGLYSRACLVGLDGFLGSTGLDHGWKRPSIRDFLQRIPHVVVPEAEVREISPDWSLFFNINRPSDLEGYLATCGDPKRSAPVPGPEFPLKGESGENSVIRAR